MPLDTNHARCVSVPSRLGCTQMTQISLPLSSLVPRATDSSSSIGLRAPPASVWHPPLLEICLVFHCTLIRAHQHPSGGKDAHIQTHCRASHSPLGQPEGSIQTGVVSQTHSAPHCTWNRGHQLRGAARPSPVLALLQPLWCLCHRGNTLGLSYCRPCSRASLWWAEFCVP